MQYILMNYEYEAAILSLDTDYGTDMVRHIRILDPERVPFMIRGTNDPARAMGKWIVRRMIPSYRKGLSYLTNVIGEDIFDASLYSYGQSLTDGYWFRPIGDSTQWEAIGFRKTGFSNDIGYLSFGFACEDPNLYSPDFTTNGQLPKTWRERNGDAYLLKGGSAPDYEEPHNENIASSILAKIARVPYVTYEVGDFKGKPVSVCKNFIREGTEFVSAADLMSAIRRPPYLTQDMHLEECCKTFHIPYYRELLDTIRYLDYLIANTDRHFGNFGFLYDVRSCQFFGPAPIFDSGTALWNLTEFPEESKEEAAAGAMSLAENLSEPEVCKPISGRTVKELIIAGYKRSDLSEDRIMKIAELAEIRAGLCKESIHEATARRLNRLKHTGRSEFVR
ncbi:MAG: hypothetical protein LUE86_14000 [Clostridiales bacterium]|nr:hypothetical protein [Clostridiales bacterium]